MHVYVRVSSGIAESCDWNCTASRGFGGMPTRLIVCDADCFVLIETKPSVDGMNSAHGLSGANADQGRVRYETTQSKLGLHARMACQSSILVAKHDC